jgi:hypothetical protein
MLIETEIYKVLSKLIAFRRFFNAGTFNRSDLSNPFTLDSIAYFGGCLLQISVGCVGLMYPTCRVGTVALS